MAENPPKQTMRPTSRNQAADAAYEARNMNADMGDLELRADMDYKLEDDPIARAGFDAKAIDTRGIDPTYENAHYDPNSDKIEYGAWGANPPVIAHEARHRGIYQLRDMLDEDPEWFEETYGKDAVQLLNTVDDELVTEMGDNPDDTWNTSVKGGRDGKTGLKVESMDRTITDVNKYTLREYIKNGRIPEMNGIRNSEMVGKGLEGIKRAAQDMLTKRGEPPKAEHNPPGFFSKVKDKLGFAEGGSVESQMSSMMENRSMEMDPVSGNEVPPGVTAENVRDDIDAKLSEGEYVMPADVVKFFGMAHFEKMIKKAKEGMAEFEEEGRIGGKAVDEAITEMDEEEDGMLEMSDGGYTLGADIAAIDGYATGGLVDGTDYDAIIDRVKAAAGKDPSIANMLKAKGIFIEAPAPNSLDQQTAMMGGAVPTQAAPPQLEGKADASAYAEGGTVVDPLTGAYSPSTYESSFNPYAYTPGFYKGEGGLGSKPVAPVQCPTGFVLDPATNTCVPAGATSTAPQQESRDRNQNRGESYGNTGQQSNSNSWMDKYDYGDPDVLYEQTMTSLGAGKEVDDGESNGLVDSLLGIGKNILAGGIIGKFMSTTNVAQTKANALALRDMGRADLADKIDAQAGVYVKENGLKNVPKPWRDGDGLYEKLQADGRITYDPNAPKTSTVGNATTPSTTSNSDRKSLVEKTKGTNAPTSIPRPVARGESDRDSNSWESSGGVSYDRTSSTNSSGQKTTTDTARGSTAPTQTARPKARPSSSAPKTESYSQKTSRGGGYVKGGLVKRPTK
jgi:hypothetical protein